MTVATARLVRDVFAPPTVRALHSPWPQPAGGACGEEVGGGAIGVICRRRLAFLAPVFSPLSILYHRGPPWRPRLPAEWDPRGGRPARGGGPGCQPSTHDRCRDPLCAPTRHCCRRRGCLPGCLASATVRLLPTVSNRVVAAAGRGPVGPHSPCACTLSPAATAARACGCVWVGGVAAISATGVPGSSRRTTVSSDRWRRQAGRCIWPPRFSTPPPNPPACAAAGQPLASCLHDCRGR